MASKQVDFSEMDNSTKAAAKKMAGRYLVSCVKQGDMFFTETKKGLVLVVSNKETEKFDVFSRVEKFGPVNNLLFSGTRKKTVDYLVENVFVYFKHDD